MNGLTPGLDNDLKAQFLTVKRKEWRSVGGYTLKVAQPTDIAYVSKIII